MCMLWRMNCNYWSPNFHEKTHGITIVLKFSLVYTGTGALQVQAHAWDTLPHYEYYWSLLGIATYRKEEFAAGWDDSYAGGL